MLNLPALLFVSSFPHHVSPEQVWLVSSSPYYVFLEQVWLLPRLLIVEPATRVLRTPDWQIKPGSPL